MKFAATIWEEKMTNEEKIPWFKSYYEKNLLKIIERDGIRLNSASFKLITSTYNTPFVVEPLSLKAGEEMRGGNRSIHETDDKEYTKLFSEYIVNLENIRETGDEHAKLFSEYINLENIHETDYEYNKLFGELMNFDMISDN
ncbi:hypothetical protein RclHR1_02140005 [Rhizophagus clarus]|uniref:Uncharacterized protein n=1 Tax=Rhizophagus clarus TaxID=94130 RepID=A0A2Z6QXF6_9GLOM|nr:hypothetical protein RclHR1_02140005 [Rhizophagus clarus]